MNTQETIPSVPGTPFAGGIYAGRILVDGVLHALIAAPKADGERKGRWSTSDDRVSGAESYSDGFSNTTAMVEAGSELAAWARGLRIGGCDDWYLPSQDELEILYRAFKPTAETNSQYGRSGINTAAVPPTLPYTAELPAQTIVPEFAEGGTEAFVDTWYWSSTQHAAYADYAWSQDFNDGYQDYDGKSASLRARAVRRFAI